MPPAPMRIQSKSPIVLSCIGFSRARWGKCGFEKVKFPMASSGDFAGAGADALLLHLEPQRLYGIAKERGFPVELIQGLVASFFDLLLDFKRIDLFIEQPKPLHPVFSFLAAEG